MSYFSIFKQLRFTRTLILLLFITLTSACVTAPELYTEQDAKTEQSRDLADLDRDGIINERDECTESPSDAVIDNDGCPALTGRPKVKYRIIHFGFDKSSLSAREHKRVLEMATFLKKYPETNLYLIGDTSSEGSDSYNQKLAKRRINSVHKLLQANGISNERLKQEIYSLKNHLPPELTGRDRRLIAVLQWPSNYKDYQVEWSIFTEMDKERLTY